MHKTMAFVLMQRAYRETDRREYFLECAAKSMVRHYFSITHADIQLCITQAVTSRCM